MTDFNFYHNLPTLSINPLASIKTLMLNLREITQENNIALIFSIDQSCKQPLAERSRWLSFRRRKKSHRLLILRLLIIAFRIKKTVTTCF